MLACLGNGASNRGAYLFVSGGELGYHYGGTTGDHAVIPRWRRVAASAVLPNVATGCRDAPMVSKERLSQSPATNGRERESPRFKDARPVFEIEWYVAVDVVE